MIRENCRRSRILAHRGDMESGPENTRTALNGAVEKGADGVEIDIRMTKDGQIVVFHDEELSRVAECPGSRIKDLTWSDIQKITLPFAGHLLRPFPEGGYQDERECFLPENMTGEGDLRVEKILLFDEFLDWLMDQDPGFLAEVEYKAEGMMDEVIRLLKVHGAEKRCILFSGEIEHNREIQDWCRKNGKPEGLRLGANIRFLNSETMKEIEQYDLWEAGLNAWAFGEDEVKYLNDRGIAVFSNLGDTPAWWERMSQLNVTAFKTNCPGPYRTWYREKYGI
ncbi:MAG: glycerophosphodiester phosphodiesterase family protein [Lachnospiraceae bacterium]|nr:glycerophosphodiester phosphodiesterase family protein [Lachnospiraceae bacterium]